MNDEGNYLRTDEINEFLDDLNHLEFLLSLTTTDNRKWKWVVLTMHNTMEGLFICHLRGSGTTSVPVLERRIMKAYLEKLNTPTSTEDWPIEKLAPLKELYSRIKNKKFLSTENRLKISADNDWAIKILNHLRNQFDHFIPSGLSVELSGLPDITRSCCNIIEELAIRRPTMYSRLPNHADTIKKHLNSIHAHLETIEESWQKKLN